MTTPLGHRHRTAFAPSLSRRPRFPWRRGVLLAPTLALLAAMLVTGPALSALRVGTKNGETLLGTSGNDHIIGAEGDDTLKGLVGNDSYFFADGWGADKLFDKPGQGTDTLNFHGVRLGLVIARVVPEWKVADPRFYAASGPAGESITFGSPTQLVAIEKVVGGQGNGDDVSLGGGPHIFMPGGGATDTMQDLGGWNDGTAGLPEIPASNDTYKGFADNTGTDFVEDFGGVDVVDMRPFSTDDVYLSRRDQDVNGTEESLQIVTGPTAQVILIGHYRPLFNLATLGMRGRIEKLIFTDVTFTSANGLTAAVAAAATPSGKQIELAEAADRLAEEARTLMPAIPEPGR